MESTSPKKLRAELKDYLDMAANEPIRIQRRSGENYVLMNENKYAELKNEISSLQRRLLAMNDIADGRSSEYKGKEDRLKRLKK
jgi:PHD/YefM family antitoxin component YafN of YafNO toxin-antitoxin module